MGLVEGSGDMDLACPDQLNLKSKITLIQGLGQT